MGETEDGRPTIRLIAVCELERVANMMVFEFLPLSKAAKVTLRDILFIMLFQGVAGLRP